MKPILLSSQKGELQANFLNEYQCKNPQQNNDKPNPTTHQKAHSP
jgi:hypothetical protein